MKGKLTITYLLSYTIIVLLNESVNNMEPFYYDIV